MSRSWTPSQRMAIDETGRDLVVSAGAGAGKTSTLVERIVSRIADKKSPAGIEDFLVVTFTRAAAEEMRQRIRARLEQLLDDATLPTAERARLERELYLVPRAQISTIHSWCLDLVAAHATKLELPPSLEVVPDMEESLRRAEIVERRVERLLADERVGPGLRRVMRALDPLAQVAPVAKLSLRVASFLEALPDPHAFVDAVCGEWRDAAEAGARWDETRLGRELIAVRDAARARARTMANSYLALEHAGAQTDSRRKYLAELRDVAAALAGKGDVPDCSGLKFTASRKEPDALSELWKSERKDFLGLVEELRFMCAMDVPAYFQSRAEAAQLLLVDLGIGFVEEVHASHKSEHRISYPMLEHLARRLLVPKDGSAPLPAGNYREILVDEYQDVSPLQASLFAAIQGNAATRPTQFRVGDIKQSIYGFRHAAPELFRDMLDAAEGRIDLRENFRSEPVLLRELNKVLADVFSREIGGVEYDDAHSFLPGKPDSQPTLPALTVTAFFKPPKAEGDEDAGEFSEAEHVARAIAELGRPWRDVVILLRKRGRNFVELGEALDAAGVPWESEGMSGLLDTPEVAEVHGILRAVLNPHDEIGLLGALRGAGGEFGACELLELKLGGGGESYLRKLESAARAGTRVGMLAQKFLTRLRAWQSESVRLPLASLVARIYDALHLEARSIVKPGGERRVRNLGVFLELATEFDRFARRGLPRFLNYLSDLSGNERASAPPASSGHAVRLLTIHQSKGMEFPVVVLPFSGGLFNESDLRAPVLLDRDHGAAFRRLEEADSDAPDPLFDALARRRRRAMLGEEMRLMYVALTRAQERVLMFGSGGRRPWAKWYDGEVVRLDGGPLSNPQRESATTTFDWMLMHCVRRFRASLGNGELPLSLRDGSLAFEVREARAAEFAEPHESASERARPARDVEELRRAAHARLAEVPGPAGPAILAKVSVSEVKRALDERLGRNHRSFAPELAPQAWRAREGSAPRGGGVAAGSATHRFLSLADFAAIREGRTVQAERDRLCAAGALSDAEGALVLLDEIAGFLNAPLGMELMRCAATAMRETPFTLGVDPEELSRGEGAISSGPVVLQGVVDLHFRQADGGIVLIDFKTDKCGAEGSRVDALTREYTPQIVLYRAALESVLGESVASAHLVFLRGDRVVEVPRRRLAREEIATLLRPAVVSAETPDPRRPREAR